jgi:hypothetical protein
MRVVIEFSLDRAQMIVRALACMIVVLFRMMRTDQKMSDGVQRLPTAYLLPIVAQTEIRHSV